MKDKVKDWTAEEERDQIRERGRQAAGFCLHAGARRCWKAGWVPPWEVQSRWATQTAFYPWVFSSCGSAAFSLLFGADAASTVVGSRVNAPHTHTHAHTYTLTRTDSAGVRLKAKPRSCLLLITFFFPLHFFFFFFSLVCLETVGGS